MDVTAALFTVAVTVGSVAPAPAAEIPYPAAPIAAAIAAAGNASGVVDATETATLQTLSLTRQPPGRPGALVLLYASLAVMQGLDIYTTSKAVSGGGVELNPAMRPVAGKTWGSVALKAASTAGSIYFIERAWKQNRKGAVILATVINVATAAVVVHNTR